MEHASRPRPRHAAITKERILSAAQEVFTRSGYARGGLREIATAAGVTSALVVRYFGTKAALFEAALIWTMERNTVFTTDKQCFGAEMAAMMPGHSGMAITAMLVMALADSEARPVATRVARERMIEPLAEWLGPPHAMERAMNMFGLMTGFVVQNQGIIPGEIPARTLDWFARSLQSLVDQGQIAPQVATV